MRMQRRASDDEQHKKKKSVCARICIQRDTYIVHTPHIYMHCMHYGCTTRGQAESLNQNNMHCCCCRTHVCSRMRLERRLHYKNYDSAGHYMHCYRLCHHSAGGGQPPPQHFIMQSIFWLFREFFSKVAVGAVGRSLLCLCCYPSFVDVCVWYAKNVAEARTNFLINLRLVGVSCSLCHIGWPPYQYQHWRCFVVTCMGRHCDRCQFRQSKLD